MPSIGINYFSHDTSISLIEKDKVMAIEEERLSRRKHAAGFWLNGREPVNSMDYLSTDDIDTIIHGWSISNFNAIKTRLTSDFITSRYVDLNYNKIKRNFIESMNNIRRLRRFEKTLNNKGIKIVEVEHHLSHASLGYRLSKFKRAGILVSDSNGEDESISLWYGKNNEIEKICSYPSWQSIGKLYTRVSNLLGMGIGGEGKTMALASYASPRKYSFVEINEYGFRILWEKLRHIPQRKPNGVLKKIHLIAAASLQHDLEKISLFLVNRLKDYIGGKNLCLSGGAALNCQLNTYLFKNADISRLYIPSAPNDSGVSLGALLEYNHRNCNDIILNSYSPFWGTCYEDNYIENVLQKHCSNISYEKIEGVENIVAKMLSEGKVCGFFNGNMEFGPRALGNRSILGHPSIKGLKDRINKIKGRELWRPLSPAILEEKASKYFEKVSPSYMMTFVFEGIDWQRKDMINVLHVDNTARLQTVNKKLHPKLYALLKEFYKITNIPMLINTSFNLKDEPIVMSPKDAISSFKRSNLDFLVIENFIIKRR